MKIVIVGDTHGRTTWRSILEKENPDRIVFIGDYFDSHEKISASDQIKNFLEIVSLPNSICLIGNHDFHYMPWCAEPYSSFQHLSKIDIWEAIKQNMDKLHPIYQIGNILCTHAGISLDWAIDEKTTFADMYNWGGSIDSIVTNIWKNFKECFDWQGPSPYGNSINESPIWIRPDSLAEGSRDFPYIQIVGHTPQPKGIVHCDSIWFIDCLGTVNQYLILDDADGSINIGEL